MTASGLKPRVQRVPPPGGMLPPPDSQISVWWATTDIDPATLEGLRADLDRDTLDRVNALVREEDRRRAVIAHGLLRRLVAACLGVEPHAIAIDRTCANCGAADHGKPTLASSGVGGPSQPALQFNLAHSGTIVAVALAGPGTEVGIDVEAVQPQMRWSTIRRHVFSDAEWDASEATDDPTATRFALWARKEAAAKTTGHGLAIDLRHVDIDDATSDAIAASDAGSAAAADAASDDGSAADGPLGAGAFRAGKLEAPERVYPLVVADLPIDHDTAAAVAVLAPDGAGALLEAPPTIELIRAQLD